MDLWLIETNENIQISPASIHGMLWLQTHFNERHWETLSSNQGRIPKEDRTMLFEDAKSAGLNLNFLQNLCIAQKF